MCCILFISSFFDDNWGWEFSDCWSDSYKTLIYCEIEDGKYYYFALGRLLSIRDYLIDQSYSGDLCRELGIYSYSDIFRCPKYEIKRVKRENLLTKLLG